MSDQPLDPEEPTFLDDEQFSTPQVANDFQSLLNVGYVEEKYVFAGNEIVLFTPKIEAELAAAQLIHRYEGTLAQGRALMVSEVAAALRSVNGESVYMELDINAPQETYVRKQFEWILKNWQWPTVEIVHNFWKDLQIRQIKAITEAEGK